MTAVDFLHSEYKRIFGDVLVKPSQGIEMADALAQAKQMEKEQITDAFAECWKANVPNGIECKLDAEQYFNETFNTKEK